MNCDCVGDGVPAGLKGDLLAGGRRVRFVGRTQHGAEKCSWSVTATTGEASGTWVDVDLGAALRGAIDALRTICGEPG